MSPQPFEKIRALLNATKILKDVLASEKEPEFFTVVTVPEGTEIKFGGVNEHAEWGCGGEMQYEIVGMWDKNWFAKLQRIKP